MPPRIKITDEQILNTAVEIVQKQGIDRLNARSLAAELGCSVQPIFRVYDSMEDLKKAVFTKVSSAYVKYLEEAISLEDEMLGLVYAYVRFAREEKFFFQYLHMSGKIDVKRTEDFTTVGINKEIVGVMAQMTGLSIEQSQFLYAGIFFTAHGMASMIATNVAEFTDEEIKRIITTMFWGTVEKLKSDG